MHLGDPVAQGIDNQIAYHRMVAVDRVAATGVVGVLTGLRVDDVINTVVQPTHGDGSTLFIALTGVVEHHVEDHFDTGFMQRLDHRLEFANLRTGPLVDGVGSLGGEEAQWVVAPEVM